MSSSVWTVKASSKRESRRERLRIAEILRLTDSGTVSNRIETAAVSGSLHVSLGLHPVLLPVQSSIQPSSAPSFLPPLYEMLLGFADEPAFSTQ